MRKIIVGRFIDRANPMPHLLSFSRSLSLFLSCRCPTDSRASEWLYRRAICPDSADATGWSYSKFSGCARAREERRYKEERVTHALTQRMSGREGAIARTEEAWNATTIRRQFAAILVRCQCQLIDPTADFHVCDLSICLVITLLRRHVSAYVTVRPDDRPIRLRS